MPDLATAHAAAQAGMEQALRHAERESPDWAAVALAFVHKYARTHRTFVAEDCVAAAVEWGLACAQTKAYGPVLRSAARLGIITKIGYVPSRNRHCSPTVQWMSNVYKGAPA